MKQLVIKNMELEQVEGVHRIFEECFTMEKWSRSSIEYELTNPIAVTLVAMDGDQVAGFVNVHHIMGEGDLNDIAVSSAYRRQGVAASLMQQLFLLAKEKGISSYTLEVRASNHGAIAFYEKMGFVPVGERKNYYSKPVENALLYRVDLGEV
ncbi:MAG: ribosomal protein S18-alanine N-acetyltransferase [Massiliimalia sp.]|jgi:ribosomal-protein-alanine N-acetyltransferase